jgi:large subunit ribosomal protein L13
MTKNKGTFFATKEAANSSREWFVVDADGLTLGRLSSQVASVLRGKHKPTFTPHVDGGDFVIVLNADKVVLTGRKLENKLYRHHTGYIGGLKTETAADAMKKHPHRIIENAVFGMLPKGILGKEQRKKLKVYAGSEHPHLAQQPKPLMLGKLK